MRKLVLAALLIFISGSAFAQSNPGLRFGQVPTAAQWNSFFAAKQDYLGVPILTASNVLGVSPISVVTTGSGTTTLVTISCPSCVSLSGTNVFTGSNTFTSTFVINRNAASLPVGPTGTIFQAGQANDVNAVATLDSFGASAGTFSAWTTRRSRGTAAAPSAVLNLDNLGIFSAAGYMATGYSLAGTQIRFIAGENFTDTAQGTFASIFSTPAGAAASAFVERARFGASSFGTPGAVNTMFGLTTFTPIANNTSVLPAGPTGTLLQISNINDTATVAVLDTFGASATTFPVFNTRRARGTIASPTAVQNLDNLGIIGAIGYGSTGYSLAGTQLRFIAAQNFTDAAQGTFASIFSTPAGSTASAFAERMRFGATNTGTAGTTSTLFGTGVITASGNNTIAIPAGPTGTLFQIANADDANTVAVLDSFGTAAFSAWTARKARGTTASPTAVQNLDNLGIFSAVAYGATAYSLAGTQLRFIAAQNFTDAAQGTFASIFTTPAGSTAASFTERARFGADPAGTAGNSNTLIGSTSILLTNTAQTVVNDTLLTLNRNTASLRTWNNTASEVWNLQIGGADGVPAGMGVDNYGTFGFYDLRRANGTAASPTALVGDDLIGVIGALGYMGGGGTGYSAGAAQVRFLADANWSATSNPTRVSIWTTPVGSLAASFVEAVRFGSDASTKVTRLGIGSVTGTLNSGVLLTTNANSVALPAPLAGTIAQYANADNSYTLLVVDSFGASGGASVYGTTNYRTARGTAASPTAVQLDDILGVIAGSARGTSQYNPPAAQLRFVAAENQTNTAAGARLEFHITPNGTTTLTEAMRVTNAGGLAVGLTTNTTIGVVNVLTGFRVNSAATSGNVLRGNGTNFVSAQLAFSDLSGSATSVNGVSYPAGPYVVGDILYADTTTSMARRAAVAVGSVLASQGVGVVAAWSGTIQLGASGTLGSVTFGNATSGLLTLQPVTGALGTVTVSIPAATTTLVGTDTTQTLTNKTIGAYTLSGTISGGGNQINNVIIGTVTPLAGLFTTVGGTIATFSDATTPIIVSGGAGASLIRATGSGGAYNIDVGTGNATTSSLAWRHTNGFTTALLFDFGGGGIQFPISSGYIRSTSNGPFFFDVSQGGSSGTLVFRQGAGSATRWTMDTAGNFVLTTATDAISTSTGAIQNPGGMSVNKRVWMNGLTAASGTPNALCNNSGEVTINSALTCTVSSLIFKHDFVSIKQAALPVLMKMQPGTFFYNDNDARQRVGFASEYMAQLDRRLADGFDATGNPRSIDQNAILAFTVKAVQEIAATNDNFEARLQVLERR